MKKPVQTLFIFSICLLVYFGVATKFSFKPKWALDYFNPLAQSLLHSRLDLPNPSSTHDLVFFQNKWYAPWGPLASFPLLIPQLLLGRFIPTIYISVLFASIDIVIVYLLLERLKKEFFSKLTKLEILLITALFAFGTTHFYVGTLGSVWHVDQIVTNVLGTLGIYFIFKKERSVRDYMCSAWVISLALLGRATIVLLIIMPAFLYAWQYRLWEHINSKPWRNAILQGILIFALPLSVFSSIFFGINYARFHNPFEFGYSYIKESPNLEKLRLTNGAMSIRNIPRNMWYMLFEIPTLGYEGKVHLGLNLNGNSIFFLTPPFIAILFAFPFIRKKHKIVVNPYVSILWLSAIVTIIPSLMIYSTGWMQFGYRYSLDITLVIVLLSLFALKGKLNVLYVCGILFSVIVYIFGINILM